MKKSMLILLIIGIMIPFAYADARWEQSYKYQGDYTDTANQIFSSIDFDTINRVSTINHDMGMKTPVVIDLLGQQSPMYSRQIVTYRNGFTGGFVEVHHKVDGTIRLLSSKPIPNVEILDIIGITAHPDSAQRGKITVIYRDGNEIKFNSYVLQGTNLQEVSTPYSNRVLDNYTQVTSIHCAENLEGSSLSYMCAYGIERNGEHKVVTFGNTLNYNRIITFEDDVMLNQPTRRAGPNVLESTVVVGIINERLFVVDYHAPLGTITSRSNNEGDRGYNQTVTLYDISTCGTNCYLTHDEKINVYQNDNLKYSGNPQKLITSVTPIPFNPIDNNKYYNGDVLKSVFGIAFMELEAVQAHLEWPSTTSRLVQNFVYMIPTLDGQIEILDNYEIQDIATRVSANDVTTRTNLYHIPTPIFNSRIISTFLTRREMNDVCTTSNILGQIAVGHATRILCMTNEGPEDFFAFTTHELKSYQEQRPLAIVGTLTEKDNRVLIIRDYNGNTYFTIDEHGVQNALPEIISDEMGIFFPATLREIDTTFIGPIQQLHTQDLIHITEDRLYVYYEFDITVDTIITDPELEYDGISGFYNPGQVNTTQIFRATKCLEDLKNCNFVNMNTNPSVLHQLCTTCGDTQNYTCGPSSFVSPSVSCIFNETGTYNIQLDLFTTNKPDEVAQTFNVNNLVITEEENKQENLVKVPTDPVFDVPVPPPSIIIHEDDKPFIELIQDNIKILTGLLIIIILVSTIAAQGIRNPIILLFVAIVGLIMTNVLGLISMNITIMLLVGIVVLILLSMTVFKGREGGM